MKFLESKGYKLQESTLHQDNESTIIDIRYFATKDRLKRGNIQVVYCPTETMVADYFTKPL